jgi:hypothetical protein
MNAERSIMVKTIIAGLRRTIGGGSAKMTVLAYGRLPRKARGRSVAAATQEVGVRSAGPVFEGRLIIRRRSLLKSPGRHRRAPGNRRIPSRTLSLSEDRLHF